MNKEMDEKMNEWIDQNREIIEKFRLMSGSVI